MSFRSLHGLSACVWFFLAALTTAGCGGKKEEGPAHKDIFPAEREPPRKLVIQPLGQPDVAVDPAAWHAEFKKNPKAALAKYKDKVVELAGTVKGVGEDPHGQVGYVYLAVEGSLLGIRCATADKTPWRKVAPGSKVKIKGKVEEEVGGGRLGSLFPAEIVEAGPNPAPILAAPELAKEYAADRKAVREKYDAKWVYVEGEVTEKKSPQEGGAVRLTLKGDKGISIDCGFPAESNKKALEAVKVGSSVKVLGQLSVFADEQDTGVALTFCQLTPAP
jgi:hypothetical protein